MAQQQRQQQQQQQQRRPQGPEFSVVLRLTEIFKVGDEWFVTAMIQVKHRRNIPPDMNLNHVVDVYRNVKVESSSVPLDRNGMAKADIRIDSTRMNYIQAHFVGTGFSSQVETVFVKPEEKKPPKKLLPPMISQGVQSRNATKCLWQFIVRLRYEDDAPAEGKTVYVLPAVAETPPTPTDSDGVSLFTVAVKKGEQSKFFRLIVASVFESHEQVYY